MSSQTNPNLVEKIHHWESGIMVLKNWGQVGDAINYMSHYHYRTHRNPYKTWDLRLIAEMVGDLARDEPVVDLGASVLGSVRLLHEMGFKRIKGYDLAFSKFDRLIQIYDWFNLIIRTKRIMGFPYRLKARNLYDTGLKDGSVSAITCLSVIEHNVDQHRFFAEMSRLMRPKGHLFLSTDYWEPKLDTSHRKMFGQPWTIFCREEIQNMINIAESHGLTVNGTGQADFSCENVVVIDFEHAYTTIAIRFYKR